MPGTGAAHRRIAQALNRTVKRKWFCRCTQNTIRNNTIAANRFKATDGPSNASCGHCRFAQRFGQVFERHRDAALAMRHSGNVETHLDAAESSGKHQVVKITEVSNAERFVLQ